MMTVSSLTQEKGDEDLARERISQAILETSRSCRHQRQSRRKANRRASTSNKSPPSSSSSGSSPCASPPPRPLLDSAAKALSAMKGPIGPVVGVCGGEGRGGGTHTASDASSSSGCRSTISNYHASTATNWELSLFDDLAIWDAKCRREKAKKLAAKERDAAARAAALVLMQGPLCRPSSLSSSVTVPSSSVAAVAKPAAARKAAAASTFYSPESVLLSAAASGPWTGSSRLLQQQQHRQGSSFLSSGGEEGVASGLDGGLDGGGGDLGTPRSLLLRGSSSSSASMTANASGGSLATPPGFTHTQGDAEFDGGAFDADGDYNGGGGVHGGRNSDENGGETLEELANGFADALDGAWWRGFCLAA